MSITFYESNNVRQERAARSWIAGLAKAQRNAAEWRRRANVARGEGNDKLADSLKAQAFEELRPYEYRL